MMHVIPILITVLGLLCLGYLSILVYLYLYQRRLLYLPNTTLLSATDYHLSGIENIVLTALDETKITCWYYPTTSGNQHKIILYFHGNKGHIGDRAGKLQQFINQGFGVLAVSYRGYGSSEGFPTEMGLYADGRAAMQFLRFQKIPGHQIILYGESLGSGIATQLATEFDISALILEAPYTSMVNVAQEHYPLIPIKYLLKDIFDSESKISKVTAPVLIFHGECDDVIPIHHGKKLFSLVKGFKKGVFFEQVNHTNYDSKQLAKLIVEFMASSERTTI
jgi:uncharacterized protein